MSEKTTFEICVSPEYNFRNFCLTFVRNNNMMSLFQYFQRSGKTQVSKPSKLCESIKNNSPENINGKRIGLDSRKFDADC